MRTLSTTADLQTIFALQRSTAERLVRERSEAIASRALEAQQQLGRKMDAQAHFRATGHKEALRAPTERAAAPAFIPRMIRV